ncbi:hypothetical protein SLEP1_g24521 [Rubroshorea leprosula]|uniref:Ycf15 n=1 Tax=Rubroshorea leprosula TaxID=152421 RepID=A0AAV5JL91_9ROSI|nr:hypothetical protein SLEP1_g24521 [Rubroshorea leprosula]
MLKSLFTYWRISKNLMNSLIITQKKVERNSPYAAESVLQQLQSDRWINGHIHMKSIFTIEQGFRNLPNNDR